MASTDSWARSGSNMKLNTVARTMGKTSVHTTALGVCSSVRTVVVKVVHTGRFSLIAQLATGDLEEDVVEGGRCACDAPHADVACAQRRQNVGEVVLAGFA